MNKSLRWLKVAFHTALMATAGIVCADEPHTFDSFAKPFLQTHCLDCHGEDAKEGDIAFHKLAGVDADNFGLWQRIWEQVSIKEMPPKEEDQPDRIMRYEMPLSVFTGRKETNDDQPNDHCIADSGGN